MKPWFPKLTRERPAPAPALPDIATAPAPIDLRKFDALTADEISALPKRLRKAVIADRRERVTARLRVEADMVRAAAR